ncbi:hypothetical protein N9515_09465 [Vicingaceae bacterium]|nr:hypothetical protein [Vicingaceae bacterium]
MLNEQFGKRIEKTDGKVILASATLEIVKNTTVNFKDEKATDNKN